MTPFQPLYGRSSRTALDVLRSQADYTEIYEGEQQQEGSQQPTTKIHDSSASDAADPYPGSNHGGLDAGGGQIRGGGA